MQQHLGWSTSFLAASIGLIIGVITFVALSWCFDGKGYAKTQFSFKAIANLCIGLITVTIIAILLIQNSHIAEYVLVISGVILFAALVRTALQLHGAERQNMFALILLIFVSIIFWALFFQIFFSMNLFVARDVDRHIFNVTLPPTLFISFESIFILILSPILAKLWVYLKSNNKDISLLSKFALSLFVTAFGFFLLYLATATSGSHLIPAIWVILAYLCITLGELLLSPIGLSMITTLSPRHLVGAMMGVWFFALGMGGELAGVLAKYSAVPKDIANSSESFSFYGHAFLIYAVLALLFGILLSMVKSRINMTTAPA